MAFVQAQRVRIYPTGEDLVLDYQNAEISTHREYLELIGPFERACRDGEITRTVAEGAPKYRKQPEDITLTEFLR